jgi:Tfp pilus assembly pilus retraction ATPase PilT
MAFYNGIPLWDYYRHSYCRNMDKIMNKPYRPKYNWNEFDNTLSLTDYQKLRIKVRFKRESKNMMQRIINESVSAKKNRRSELNAHNDPNNPFKLDIGGEG